MQTFSESIVWEEENSIGKKLHEIADEESRDKEWKASLVDSSMKESFLFHFIFTLVKEKRLFRFEKVGREIVSELC